MKDDKTEYYKGSDFYNECQELLSQGLKRCSDCKIIKSRKEFHYKKKGSFQILCYCKECGKLKSKAWYEKNKKRAHEYTKQYYKKRRSKDNLFKFQTNLRNSINQALRKKGYRKKSRVHEILGCSFDEFLVHLYLTSPVNPISHPNETLHLDHIVPIASAQNEQEAVRLNHYTNLQWLTSKDNFEKGAKVL